MGSYSPPDIKVGERMVRISAFLHKPDGPPYKSSLLYQTLVEKTHSGITFPGVASEIYLEQNPVPSGVDIYELRKMEVALANYEKQLKKLSPKQARKLGFSQEFISRQARRRRVSRAVTHFLKNELEQIGT